MKIAWSPVRNSYIPLELPLGKDVNKHIQILAAVLKNYLILRCTKRSGDLLKKQVELYFLCMRRRLPACIKLISIFTFWRSFLLLIIFILYTQQ